MKSIRQPTKAGDLAPLPPLQPSRQGGTSQSRVHRQYRSYCIHPTPSFSLYHNNKVSYSIHPHCFAYMIDSHVPLLAPRNQLFPPVVVDEVFSLNPHSSNADQCHYPEYDAHDDLPHSPISLGASGLQGDSGVMPLEPCRFLDAMIDVADAFFTRCPALNSSFFEVALILFTRCPLESSPFAGVPDSLITRCAHICLQEGRFA